MSDGRRPERHEEYLQHILESAAKVARYTAALDKSAFLGDEKTQDAVIRNLEIIGEASRRILEECPGFAEQHAEVPWKKIYAMRNRLSHGYIEVNLDVVWDTIRQSLPEVEQHVRRIVATIPGDPPDSGL
jgi:uncharacterized protein with HEPN domain